MVDRPFLAGAARSAGVAAGVAAGASVALAAGRIAWDGGLIPPIPAWLALVALGVPAGSTAWIPIVGAVAAVAPLRRWVENGAWTGLRSLGISGRRLLIPWIAVGVVAGGSTALAAHVLEPAARQAARHVAAGVTEAGLVPGVSVRVGDAVLVAAPGGDVLVAGRGWIGSAQRARLAGGALVLERGSLWMDGAKVRFEQHERPIAGPRRDLAERWTPDLLAAADRTEAAGRDASYERAIGWKRWTLPLAAALAPAAVGPLGAGRRPTAALLLVGFAVFAAIRLGDRLAPTLGPAVAIAGPAAVLVAGAFTWATWRDR